jgi:hypothetical protein
MLVREREIGELPSPICPCLAERSGGDLMFLPLAIIRFYFILNLIPVTIKRF